MLEALQASNSTNCCLDDIPCAFTRLLELEYERNFVETHTYTIAKNDPLHVCWLELPSMQQDPAVTADEGLRHEQASSVSL